ncbi:MAG TPA: dihydrodipicolinate synthase family protein [Gemmatimonadaceae bacterium]|nr:dihydrodipicolinate synthase family protein [Gemmatimonadaceae bacterium]
MVLKGILAPVVSTFDRASGELDLDAFSANVRAHLAAGLHGIVVAGSTGEAVLLDETERGRLVEAARAVTPRDRLLLAGAGAESTRVTLQRARQAAAAGADAVLVVSPHYYTAAMTADALLGHFRRVADESPIPVVLYNIPKYVGFTISPSIVTELASHRNIIGIKDSSGDRDLMSVYINAQRRDFAVLTGSGAQLHAALGAGAVGGILAVALFAPELSLAVYERTLARDDAAAAAAQARLALLASTIVGSLGVAGVKAAMDAVGLHGGPVRSPLRPLSAPDAAKVRELLAQGVRAAAS